MSLLVRAAVFCVLGSEHSLRAAYLTLRSSEHDDVSLFCSVPILSQAFIRSPTDNRTFPTTLVFEYFFFWSSSADVGCGRILPALAHRRSQIKKKHRGVLCGWEMKKRFIACFFSAVHLFSLFSTSGSSDSCRKCSSATKVFSEAGFLCLSVTLPVLFQCCQKQFLVD